MKTELGLEPRAKLPRALCWPPHHCSEHCSLALARNPKCPSAPPLVCINEATGATAQDFGWLPVPPVCYRISPTSKCSPGLSGVSPMGSEACPLRSVPLASAWLSQLVITIRVGQGPSCPVLPLLCSLQAEHPLGHSKAAVSPGPRTSSLSTGKAPPLSQDRA